MKPHSVLFAWEARGIENLLCARGVVRYCRTFESAASELAQHTGGKLRLSIEKIPHERFTIRR